LYYSGKVFIVKKYKLGKTSAVLYSDAVIALRYAAVNQIRKRLKINKGNQEYGRLPSRVLSV
jgi:hypothetical protein